MRIPITATLFLTTLLATGAGQAAADEPWTQPGWEPITASERQPPAPDEIPASAVPVQEHNGIRYLTGGLGTAERAWLKEHGATYPLFLQFSQGTRGAFVSSVQVTLRRAGGETVFEATTDGPLIYVDLPAGRYQLTADYRGQQRELSLSIPNDGQQLQRSINFP
ncbi:MAG TPA: hypothetical protein VK979_05620 [Guyparkeria sp.]|nr:hypothetical protein [Guyparkeria sp.]